MTTGIITTFESGVDVVFEWRIKKFYTLQERDDAEYNSPDFSFGGERWWLKIFPNGSSGSDSSGHVDLCLGKFNSDRSIKQSISLSLKTVIGEKYNEQHGMKDFKIGWDCHSFNRFMHRLELDRRSSELVPDGVLTVVCTMKSSTSTGSAKEEASNAEVNKSDVPEASGSSQAGTTTTKESVSKWIKENNKKASKGKKRKMEEENAGDDPEHAYVGVSTKTVEASTQTVKEKCEACASGSSINPQEKKVLRDFKELFLRKEDCDVTIKVKCSEFPAHRVILKARSPVFASTFRHDMKENTTGMLEIQDCDSSIFSDFLCFLYCGDVGIISQENVFGLFTAADKYQVLDLRAKCLEFMKKNVSVDTFCENISLALRHSETELIKLCTDYFKKNVPKIIVTVKWQTFLAENPTESNELLVKCFVPNSS